MMNKATAARAQFERALRRLEDVLQQKKSEFIRDAAVQRFEFTFDVAWKALKALLEEQHGVIVASPKECFRAAYRQGIIAYDMAWIEMTDTRNKTAHIYNEAFVDEVYKNLPDALQKFRALAIALRKRKSKP